MNGKHNPGPPRDANPSGLLSTPREFDNETNHIDMNSPEEYSRNIGKYDATDMSGGLFAANRVNSNAHDLGNLEQQLK